MEVTPAIHVLIVDQQRSFHDALADRLRAEPDLVVDAEAQSAESARPVLAGRSTDVILLDAELPDDSGLAFCAEMTHRIHAPRVVMLSAASSAERVIRGVVHGETWLPPAELGPVLRLLIEDQDRRRGHDELLATLTPREREVLQYLVDGAGRKEVAERLQVSANTVRTHLQSLMAKLGVHSTLEAVALTRPRLEALPEIRQPRSSVAAPGARSPGSGRRRRDRARRTTAGATPLTVRPEMNTDGAAGPGSRPSAVPHHY